MSQDKMAELKYVSSIVRALISSCKPPCLLNNILKDYIDMESTALPYRKLGYKSPKELLVATGDFNFQQCPNGDVIITAKSSKSSHIKEMVRNQKSTKRPRKSKPFRIMKKSENNNSYQQRYSQKLQQSSFKAKLNVSNYAFHKEEFSPQANYTNTEATKTHTYRPILGAKYQSNLNNKTNNMVTTAEKYKDYYVPYSNGKEMNNNGMRKQDNEISMSPIKNHTINKVDISKKQENVKTNEIINAMKSLNINTAESSIGSNNVGHPSEYKKAASLTQWEAMQVKLLRDKNLANNQEGTNELDNYSNKFQAKPVKIHQMESKEDSIKDWRPRYATWDKEEQNNNNKDVTIDPQIKFINNKNSSSSLSCNNQGRTYEAGNYIKQKKSQTVQQLSNVIEESLDDKSIHVGGEYKQPNRLDVQSRLTKYKNSDRNVAAYEEPNPNMRITFSVNDRLKIYNQNQLENMNNNGGIQMQQGVSSMKLLSDYCQLQGYSEPEYHIFKDKYPEISYSCTLIIDESVYSTYPYSYKTAQLAQEACSSYSLKVIRETNNKKPLPECSFTDVEFLNCLYEELSRHPHGIFAKKLPELFGELFNQSLPDQWLSLVKSSNKFLIDTISPNNVIIYANDNNDDDQDDNKMQQQQQQQQQNEQPQQQKEEDDKQKKKESAENYDEIIEMEKIVLPWTEDCWNIYITHCVSTTEIWACLLDDDNSNRWELLTDEIHAYMDGQTDNQGAVATASINACDTQQKDESIKKNHFYLVYNNESWHRIQLKELNNPKNIGLCFFIDTGDTMWLPLNELYKCKREFLNVPAQAIQFALYGLEDFENNPYAYKCLNEILLDKECVGKILTKANDFYNNDNNNNDNQNGAGALKIYTVLFDTTLPDDMTLNDHIINKIFGDAQVPEIRENIIENAIITNVCDDGVIYLQVRTDDFKYIQSIIDHTVKTKLNMKQHKVTYDDLTNSKYFLICDDNSKDDIKWYRGEIINNMNKLNYQLDDNNLEIFYIDFGIKRRIHISKIYLLENLSVVLKRFPRQAIKVRLHNIPNITYKIIGQIRGLLPVNCMVLVKSVVAGSIPLVRMCKRLRESGILCNINDAICMEYELEQSSHNVQEIDTDLLQNEQFIANVDITSEKCYSKLQKLKDYLAIPKIDGTFGVRVATSKNPSEFIIQPHDNYAALQKLMKELQSYCKQNDTNISIQDIEIGQAYAAKHIDGHYYRAIALKKFDNIVDMIYCDYGFNRPVTSDQLKILPNEFRQLPKMAIKAKLYRIKSINDDWTLNDSLLFRKMTVGKTFVAIVKKLYETLTDTFEQFIELELIDVSTDTDFYIHDILLDQERAIQDE